MNRQMKRMMQRQGQIGPDGDVAPPQPQGRTAAARTTRERVGVAEYFRQVRAELRKVAWPTRAEVFNYSVIVLVAVVVLMALIFLLDLAFGQMVIFLFRA